MNRYEKKSGINLKKNVGVINSAEIQSTNATLNDSHSARA